MKLNIYTSKLGGGKTTELVKLASKEDYRIVVLSHVQVALVKQYAESGDFALGKEPITIKEYLDNKHKYLNDNIVIDDANYALSYFFSNLKVISITSEELNIINLESKKLAE
jgi:hypothetical protein